jgi:soluble cytochrome b562
MEENMSLTAISNSSQLSTLQTNFQQMRKEFTQLGQDLSAGNLTQAQTDFVTLSQAAGSQFGSNSPITKALNSIGQALQSGNLSAAQQAFSSLSNGGAAPNAVSRHSHAHHQHGGGLQQALDQLGQALQSGNLSAAQQAFATLQQNWQTVASSAATTAPGATATTASAVSVSA